MSYKLDLSSLVMAAALSGCGLYAVQGNAQKDNIPTKARTEIWNSAVNIEVDVIWTVKDGPFKGTSAVPKGIRGSGLAVYDDESDKSYVLTAAHVFLPEDEEDYSLQIGNIYVSGKPAKVVKTNETFDLGLLVVEEVLPYHFSGKMAKEVNIGDLIAGAGFPR
ncbi:MAG: hypothetical protein AABX05_01675, partial [Nanoarchaeota archaeon]